MPCLDHAAAAQKRIKKLMEQGFHKPGDVENRLDITSASSVAKRPKKGGYQMSHHASGPNFDFPRGDARLDMTDLYAFTKPGDPAKSIHRPQCASVFQVGLAGADNERALQTGSVIRNQDRHKRRCRCRYLLQRAVRIFRRREADCDSSPSQGKQAAGMGDEGEVIVQQAPVSVGRKPW